MPDLTVRCNACGGELTADFVGLSRYDVYLEVAPCEKCIEKANDEGYEKAQGEAE